MISTWISRKLYSIFDADRVFEEMDKLELEARILEHEGEIHIRKTWILMTSLLAGVTVATVGPTRAALAGITVVSGTVVGGWWLRRRIRAIRRVTVQMDRTRAALRKRRQVYFSISMPVSRNPLICRACRFAVSAIEIMATETSETLKNATSWTDLYTDEIRAITSRSTENPEKLAIEEQEMEEMDFDAVLETLISVFKLHASEYSRALILDFLENFNFRKFGKFLKVCGKLLEIGNKIEAIELLALKKISENLKSPSKMPRNSLEIGWKQETAMALEAILEGLESGNLTRSQVELALRRTLVLIGSESALKTEEPVKIEQKLAENEMKNEEAVIFLEKERTDVDMVFEGIPLSDADKIASRSAANRDVLLDGSEHRKHEASLLGELQMVLEPRRNDFAKRERAALAKFYGVEEEQLVEEKEKEDQNFEGVGLGEDVELEPYDWRKDAEESVGLHRETDNLDFLNALASRRVQDDVIE